MVTNTKAMNGPDTFLRACSSGTVQSVASAPGPRLLCFTATSGRLPKSLLRTKPSQQKTHIVHVEQSETGLRGPSREVNYRDVAVLPVSPRGRHACRTNRSASPEHP